MRLLAKLTTGRAIMPWVRACGFCHVAELNLADRHDVAVVQYLPRHLASVQDDAVGAVEIFNDGLARSGQNERMVTADR